MKKIRYAALAAALTVLLTLFSACGKKDAIIIGEASLYPCELIKTGGGYTLSVPSREGYSWRYALENSGAFKVEPLKSDEKRSDFNILAGEPGTIDTLMLTLEKDGAIVPMAAFEIDIVFFNEHTGEFSVFESSFRELSGDVIYAEDTKLPYTMQTMENGKVELTVFCPDATSEFSINLSNSGVVSVAYGEKTEKTQKFLVSPEQQGSTELTVGLDGGEALLRYPVLVTAENILSVSPAEFEQLSLEDEEIMKGMAELQDTFGEIKFPDGTRTKSCAVYESSLPDGGKSLWGRSVIALPGDITAGYMIAAGAAAGDIAVEYSEDGKSEKIKLGEVNALSFINKTGISAVAWDSADGNAAFIVTAEKAEDAADIAEQLAALNTSVKAVPIIEIESETESETENTTENKRG